MAVETKISKLVYYIDCENGNDENDGLSVFSPFKTIQKSADLMLPGDTCIIRGGIYRERIIPKRGGFSEDSRITYIAYPNEKPIIKGSKIISSWSEASNGVWKVVLPDSFFSGAKYNSFKTFVSGPFLSNPNNWTLGMVYLNEEPFCERKYISECEKTVKTWFVEPCEDSIILYVNFGQNPNSELVEVNVHSSCFEPIESNLGYITLQGLTFKHASPQWNANGGVQQGIITAKWGFKWHISCCNVSDSVCTGIALACCYTDKDVVPEYSSYGYNVVKNNVIERCGQGGINGHEVGHNALIEGNLIQDINWQQKLDGAEQAGIKLHYAVDVIIKNNIIRRIYGNNETMCCIWLDWANQGARVTGNILYDFFGSGRDNFILYLEANAGPITVDNNILVSAKNFKSIIQLGCYNVIFAHNLLYKCSVIHNNDHNRHDPYFLPHTLINPPVGVTGEAFSSVYYNLNNIYICSTTNHNSEYNFFYENGDSFTLKSCSNGAIVSFDFGSDFKFSTVFITSEYIGKFLPLNQGLEDEFGVGYNLDTDIKGIKRCASDVLPGPFNDIKNGLNSYAFECLPQGDGISFVSSSPKKLNKRKTRMPIEFKNRLISDGCFDGFEYNNAEIVKNGDDFNVVISSNGGYIKQLVPCLSNTIYIPSITAKSSCDDIFAVIRVNFYNSKMEQILDLDIIKSECNLDFKHFQLYHLSPALAAYLEFIVETSSNDGFITISKIDLVDDTPIYHDHLVNVDEYMLPLFKTEPFKDTTTVYDETVLLYSKNGEKACGTLLHTPTGNIKVRSYCISKEYYKDVDFTIDGNILTRVDGSSIPFKSDSDFSNEVYDFYNIEGSHILVTYDYNSNDIWEGPKITFAGDTLPKTFNSLSNKKPLNIVAFGDSITYGSNTSYTDGIPPYTPGFIDLFVDRLKLIFGYDDINLINASEPGQTCGWAAKQVQNYVTPLNPDVVTVSFGMNDHYRTSPETFRDCMKTIIDKIHLHCPNAEIIFISAMMYDLPFFPDGFKNMSMYEDVVSSLLEPSIALVPMYSISQYLYNKKKILDFIPNPLHPNDYLARWYAQALVALFDNRF